MQEIMNEYSQYDQNIILDDLILSYVINSHGSLSNIDIDTVQNPIEQSLIQLLRDQEQASTNQRQNIVVEVICLETSDELVAPFDCDICYESHPTIDKIIMNCQHNMCKTCAKQCFVSKQNCPFCRQKVTIIEVKDCELVHLF
jgi:hypothetical protein